MCALLCLLTPFSMVMFTLTQSAKATWPSLITYFDYFRVLTDSKMNLSGTLKGGLVAKIIFVFLVKMNA